MIHILLVMIYLSFISLGLPDSLLGSAWPTMHQTLNVDVSSAGIISYIMSVGTIISSLQSDRLTSRFGTGKVTVFSVFLTAIALLGFSFSTNYWVLLLLAIPYGLGAGSVDASLNNYVALHYKSHHMSWLHCMWGVGAAIGPYIMSYALINRNSWQLGYRYVSYIQIALVLILFLSIHLWQNQSHLETQAQTEKTPLKVSQVMQLTGAKSVMFTFFAYCAIESTTGLWASSYLVLVKSIPVEVAASYAALFYIGITVGRALSGFLTFKMSDEQMIRLGLFILVGGIVCLMLPNVPTIFSLVALVIIGLGCAPIFPSFIHMTPKYFGKEHSQAVIGIQMASAYVGTLSMPSIFGMIANKFGMAFLPIFLIFLAIAMWLIATKFMKQMIQVEE